MKSKCGVLPLITHPSAIKASNFFKYFDIVIGISKTPGTFITFISKDLGRFFFALFNKPKEISL